MTGPVSGPAAAPRWGEVDGIRYLVVGTGAPVTVFAHGLGGSVDELRALANRLPGTRVLAELRGHGGSAPLEDGWDYDVYAADLLAVADETGAEQAVGISVSSGALLRLAVKAPDRFSRMALVLPAALDRARSDAAVTRLRRLADLVDAGDVEGIGQVLLEELPEHVRDSRAARIYATSRSVALAAMSAPRASGDVRPVESREQLRGFPGEVLVVSQADDPLHPVEVAEEVADVLEAPHLRLPAGGVFWTARKETREALTRFLSAAEG